MTTTERRTWTWPTWPTWPTWSRWLPWLPALLLVAAAVAPLVLYWLGNVDDQRLVDLDVYRTGGEAVLEGRSVYGFVTAAPQLLPFTYPPVAALLATPLAAVSWPAAQWAWTALIFLTLAVTVGFSFRAVLGGTDTPVPGTVPATTGTQGAVSASPGAVPGTPAGDPARAGVPPEGARTRSRGMGGLERLRGMDRLWAPLLFAVLMIACTYLMPVRDQVRFGQVDILLVALCLADCVARRPVWPRGMLIGLATAVKLTPGVFLIYLLITGFGPGARREQRDTFLMAALTAALLTLLPFLVIPADAADFWFRALLDPERLGANAATTNQSMRGMLIRLYLPDVLTSVLWVALVAVVAWYGFRHARRALLDGHLVAGVALVGLMAVLLSPVAWIHHLAWVVVVLGALVGDGRDPVRVRVAAGVWLYYVLPIPWWGVTIKAAEIPVLSPVLGKIVQNGFGLGALALVWLLGVWLPRRRATFRALR
ncbi:glycosyltransferase 87 family protein [Streptosporangium sp. NBC_01755]|uniref:glycosyltransferase 87 family protein n=1 Tax=unclassified Streptosporangium TaxID=2632669 RepID=UPI002DD935C3|nr:MULTISPECIES: glycosyltransferase 87 family protein [unclassified Streptosporangium]WSA25146.1 glycosyltransferase 87 family protein [Streptosporangium sp. NBC_01810]WSD03513.1 glycosyltransferase 87 family protein [Streptosporangium sp. NBC_01755]